MKYDILKEKIPKLMREYGVPSLQIAVSEQDKIELCEAYGYRDYENKIKADKDTVYQIGSVSKSFTAAALAILAKEGKIKWDDLVADHIPDFKMYGDSLANTVTIRDILCHRTGLPRHEMSWYANDCSFHETVHLIRYLKPSKPIRTYMQYQNHMYALASYLIEVVSGMPWGEFINEKILKPAGMTNTSFSYDQFCKVENRALTYGTDWDSIKRIDGKSFDNIAGAGALNSNIADLITWGRLNLNGGSMNDKEIIPKETLQECHKPQMLIEEMFPWKAEEMQMQSYGFGWFIEMYRGHKVIYHSGNVDGVTSLVSIVPEMNATFSIIVNKNSSFLPITLQYMIFDTLLDLEPVDWNDKFTKVYLELCQGYEKGKEEFINESEKNDKTSHSLEQYEGKYSSDAYGEIMIFSEKDQLMFRYGALKGELYHLCFDSFYIDITEEKMFLPFRFELNINGKIVGVKIDLEPEIGEEIYFERAK